MVKKLSIKKLSLQNYRNFSDWNFNTEDLNILLIGDNGTGKTNLLEAMSLLCPGRGLRGAKFDEICQHQTSNWTIQALAQSKIGPASIISNFELESHKRLTTFNGSKISSTELSKMLNFIWLTPQMDAIFLSASSDRRKFLDRLVYNFDEKHASRVNKYEYYLQERNKVLQFEHNEDIWLNVIENNLAKIAYDIALARLHVLRELQDFISKSQSPFPKARLHIEGEIENLLRQANLILDLSHPHNQDPQIISTIQKRFTEQRMQDKASKRTNFGTHKSDFLVYHQTHDRPAKLCSTGEQKALLISVILAEAEVCIHKYHYNPILLLDEIMVHLDDIRREYLIDLLHNNSIQTFITSTNIDGLQNFAKTAKIINL